MQNDAALSLFFCSRPEGRQCPGQAESSRLGFPRLSFLAATGFRDPENVEMGGAEDPSCFEVSVSQQLVKSEDIVTCGLVGNRWRGQ